MPGPIASADVNGRTTNVKIITRRSFPFFPSLCSILGHHSCSHDSQEFDCILFGYSIYDGQCRLCMGMGHRAHKTFEIIIQAEWKIPAKRRRNGVSCFHLKNKRVTDTHENCGKDNEMPKAHATTNKIDALLRAMLYTDYTRTNVKTITKRQKV